VPLTAKAHSLPPIITVHNIHKGNKALISTVRAEMQDIKPSHPAPSLHKHLRIIIGQFNLERTTTAIPKRSARFRRRSCSSRSTSSTTVAPRFLLLTAARVVAPVCSSLAEPKRSARTLSFSGSSYSCDALSKVAVGSTYALRLPLWRPWVQEQGPTWAGKTQRGRCQNARHGLYASPTPHRPKWRVETPGSWVPHIHQELPLEGEPSTEAWPNQDKLN
jgi:hypothetical protein